jgi:hypothetical protein
MSHLLTSLLQSAIALTEQTNNFVRQLQHQIQHGVAVCLGETGGRTCRRFGRIYCLYRACGIAGQAEKFGKRL